jgi:hypothetical protein
MSKLSLGQRYRIKTIRAYGPYLDNRPRLHIGEYVATLVEKDESGEVLQTEHNGHLYVILVQDAEILGTL